MEQYRDIFQFHIFKILSTKGIICLKLVNRYFYSIINKDDIEKAMIKEIDKLWRFMFGNKIMELKQYLYTYQANVIIPVQLFDSEISKCQEVTISIYNKLFVGEVQDRFNKMERFIMETFSVETFSQWFSSKRSQINGINVTTCCFKHEIYQYEISTIVFDNDMDLIYPKLIDMCKEKKYVMYQIDSLGNGSLEHRLFVDVNIY